METSIIISKIIISMREFQKNNNIKKQCVTNVQFIYDIIKNSTCNNIKTKAVFVFSHDDDKDTAMYMGGHLVIVLDDDTIIEPSYEIFNLKNKSYFDNIKDFMDSFDDIDDLKTKINIKKMLCDNICFNKLAQRINNGEFVITDKKFYDEQADYIENLYSKFLKFSNI